MDTAERVEVNSLEHAALRAQLQAMPLLPMKIAQQILQLRPFAHRQDMRARVAGIGPKLAARFSFGSAHVQWTDAVLGCLAHKVCKDSATPDLPKMSLVPKPDRFLRMCS